MYTDKINPNHPEVLLPQREGAQIQGEDPLRAQLGLHQLAPAGGIALCYYFIACALKAHKKFISNPLNELNDRQRRVYAELPITFETAYGIDTAKECGMPERTFKEWLKSNYFRHISHGQYEKRYK